MDRLLFFLLAGILAGFALLHIPLEGTFLESIAPITDLIAVLALLFFSLYTIYKGVRAVLGK